MNSDIIIRAEGLGKRYQLGQSVDLTRNFREALAAFPRKLARLARHKTQHALDAVRTRADAAAQPALDPETPPGTFWALRDVSFEIKRGEVVGIIGRNGAGKSTLLKVLSRITSPTHGYAEIHGRLASLLEVGTGFHPELTGRENIYLNGAILGMHKAEITRKFDEIVAFAEVEKFLDTPVKRYSSGMYVRLAFAVAAHLESEVLIVDEVLAVGDAAFQKKCLGRMEHVAQSGRTIFYVSHNLASVRDLCTRCVWLDEGKICVEGSSEKVLTAYLRANDQSAMRTECAFALDEKKDFQLLQFSQLNAGNMPCKHFDCDEPIILSMRCFLRNRLPGLYGFLSIMRLDGTLVWVSDSLDGGKNPLDDVSPGFYNLTIHIPPRTLAPGEYSFYLNFTSSSCFDGFNVDTPGNIGTFCLTDNRTSRGNDRQGFFSTILAWSFEAEPVESK